MGDGIPTTSVTLTLPNDPRLFVAKHKQCMRGGIESSLHYHHLRHIPWHFKAFASAKYGYAPRDKKYLLRKLRKVGHTLPNVYSGASRTMATTSHQITNVTPTSANLVFRIAIKGGTGRVLDAAAAARLYAAGKRKNIGFTKKQVDGQKLILMRVAEMETIATDELKAINEKLADVYTAHANKPGTKYRVRFRTA